MDLPYSELVTRTKKLFEALAQHLRSAKKQGIIFIDGINEAVCGRRGLLEALRWPTAAVCT
jgi:hypothetical protein